MAAVCCEGGRQSASFEAGCSTVLGRRDCRSRLLLLCVGGFGDSGRGENGQVRGLIGAVLYFCWLLRSTGSCPRFQRSGGAATSLTGDDVDVCLSDRNAEMPTCDAVEYRLVKDCQRAMATSGVDGVCDIEDGIMCG